MHGSPKSCGRRDPCTVCCCEGEGLSLHPDAEFSPLILEDDSDGLDHLLARVRLAIHDQLVLDLLAALDVDRMFLGEAVVPATVPGREHVGVLLVGSGKLRTGHCL